MSDEVRDFRVHCRERATGNAFSVRYNARSTDDAMRQARAEGYDALSAEEVTDDAPSGSHRPGRALALAAVVLSLAGIPFVYLAAAGVVLGAIALERSGGRHGKAGLVLGVIVLAAWALVTAGIGIVALDRAME